MSLLPKFDDDLASRVREGGCPRCGGRLDVADYPRKPRGGSIELGDDYDVRRSFCCAVEGCRRRRTPPSVRFLGRTVYVGAVALLGAAMQHGPTKQRVSTLAVLLGINRRTLVRWRRWWSSMFRTSLSCVHLVDARTGALLAALYPLDRTKNGTGRRRPVAEVANTRPTRAIVAPSTMPGMAPLLRQLITAYDRAGLPPAYVRKDEG